MTFANMEEAVEATRADVQARINRTGLSIPLSALPLAVLSALTAVYPSFAGGLAFLAFISFIVTFPWSIASAFHISNLKKMRDRGVDKSSSLEGTLLRLNPHPTPALSAMRWFAGFSHRIETSAGYVPGDWMVQALNDFRAHVTSGANFEDPDSGTGYNLPSLLSEERLGPLFAFAGESVLGTAVLAAVAEHNNLANDPARIEGIEVSWMKEALTMPGIEGFIGWLAANGNESVIRWLYGHANNANRRAQEVWSWLAANGDANVQASLQSYAEAHRLAP